MCGDSHLASDTVCSVAFLHESSEVARGACEQAGHTKVRAPFPQEERANGLIACSGERPVQVLYCKSYAQEHASRH